MIILRNINEFIASNARSARKSFFFLIKLKCEEYSTRLPDEFYDKYLLRKYLLK